MATALSDFLFTPVGGVMTPWGNVFVRLVSNNTGTAYVSAAATDPNTGKFTFTVKPPGDSYTVYTGPTSTGAWTATGNAAYSVPYVAGDDAALKSGTFSASSPYTPPAGILPGMLLAGGRPWIDVRVKGAKCDALQPGDGAITSGTATLTSATAGFTSTAVDGGKLVTVTGAGVAGADLRTTISSITNSTTAVLAANASTTVSGANFTYGTDDTTAIQAAIDSFGTNAYRWQGGIVVQSGMSCITGQITVRARVAYVGIARDASGVVAAGAFPNSTALIWLGTNANLLSFGSRVENMTVDCNNYTGSIGVYSERINEQSGVFRVLVINWLGTGVKIAPPGVGLGAQNYVIDTLECIGSTQTPAGAIGLDINCTGQGWPSSVNNISIVPISTAKITTGILLTAASFVIEKIHVENTTGQAIDVTASNVTQIKGVNAGPGVTNVINWRANNTGNSLLVEGVEGSSGFSGYAVVDLVNSINAGPPSKTLAIYCVGTGTAGLQPVYTSDNVVVSTIGPTRALNDLRRSRQSVTEAVAVSGVDASLGELIEVANLTASRVIGAPLNPATGQVITFRFTQDGTGGRNVTWNAAFVTGWLVAPNANTTSSVSFFYNGSNWEQLTGPAQDNSGNIKVAQLVTASGQYNVGDSTFNNDLILATAPRIKTSGTVPTVGSGGAGTSALSILANSTNTSGRFQVTLTAVAPGVVAGVVAFGGAPLATAPLNVVCSLSAPTAGVAAPPVIGADTYTTSGFTVRVYGPTTVTTGTYVINFWVSF